MDMRMPVVLLADGDAKRRAKMRAMLADFCLVAEAADCEAAAAVRPDAVLLGGGFDAGSLQTLERYGVPEETPVLLLGAAEEEKLARAYALGVCDRVTDDCDALTLRRRLMNLLALRDSRREARRLRQECDKNRLYAMVTGEYRFEYALQPSRLILPETTAQWLGVASEVEQPCQDADCLRAFGRPCLEEARGQILRLTPASPTFRMEAEVTASVGRRWCRISCRGLWGEDGAHLTGCIGRVTDIHDDHMQLLRLRRQANHDDLTGLSNRAHAQEKIAAALRAHPEQAYALVILDMDNFKAANDTRGHIFGDEVLCCLANRLRGVTGEGEVAARAGGDEFLLFLADEGEERIRRVWESLAGEHEGFRLSVSMGVARTGAAGRDFRRLFACADQALYAVKREGRSGFGFYTEASEPAQASAISPIDLRREDAR